MKRITFLLVTVATLAGIVAYTAHASGRPDGDSAPMYGVTIPPGYRDWKLIAVGHLLAAGKVDQLRAQLGNDIAIKAFKEGKVPFPDGTIIAAIHWTRVPSEDNNRVLAGPFPGLNLSLLGPPSMFNSWSRTQRSAPRRAAGGSLTPRGESRATRRCTRPASPATRLRKIATMSSPVTHLDTENEMASIPEPESPHP
jgi:hypothetical protein